MKWSEKPLRILYGTLVVYVLLVATHLGEFWPFSIYPMFSQAGNSWSRAIVYEIDPGTADFRWNTLLEDELPEEVFALNHIGFNTNDLANMLAKNEDWSPRRMQSVRHFFGDFLADRVFVIYRVRGGFPDYGADEVVIDFTPYFYLLPDTTVVNPKLTQE